MATVPRHGPYRLAEGGRSTGDASRPAALPTERIETYRMRRWSVRNARLLKSLYAIIERILVLCHPLLRFIGYGRLDKPFVKVESLA